MPGLFYWTKTKTIKQHFHWIKKRIKLNEYNVIAVNCQMNFMYKNDLKWIFLYM